MPNTKGVTEERIFLVNDRLKIRDDSLYLYSEDELRIISENTRSCGLCVPLRARLRPRRYRLRNDARALSRLVTLLHPRKSP